MVQKKINTSCLEKLENAFYYYRFKGVRRSCKQRCQFSPKTELALYALSLKSSLCFICLVDEKILLSNTI